MATKIDQAKYTKIKASLDSTTPVAKVAQIYNIGEMTARRIKKSKNYKSYKTISRNAHITTAQRKLMNQGHTLAEAKNMLTPAKAEAGSHEVNQGTEPGTFEEVKPTTPATQPTPAESELADAPKDDGEFNPYPGGDPNDLGMEKPNPFFVWIVAGTIVVVVAIILLLTN